MIRLHSVESLGTYDGPGVRLVLFTQGCNFKCKYCANPDTIDRKGEARFYDYEELMKLARSQRPFFGKRGGITMSGGEPLMQAKAILQKRRAVSIDTAHWDCTLKTEQSW